MISKDLFISLLNRVVPSRCRGCGGPSAQGLCQACRDGVVFLEATCTRCGLPYDREVPICGRCVGKRLYLDSVVALYLYAPPVKDLIHGWKYYRDGRSWEAIQELLLNGLERRELVLKALALDGVVPVPLHWRRQWSREFNQSLFLAEEVADFLRVPLMDGIVKRVRHTPHQMGLSAGERMRNLKGAFSLKGDVAGKVLLLVDDVATTLATASQVARALVEGGARGVHLLVLARAAGG